MLLPMPMAAMTGTAMDGIGIPGLTPTPSCRGTAFSSAHLAGAFILRGARSGRPTGVLADTDIDTAVTEMDIIPCIIRTALVRTRRTGGPEDTMEIPPTMGMECATHRVQKVAWRWGRTGSLGMATDSMVENSTAVPAGSTPLPVADSMAEGSVGAAFMEAASAEVDSTEAADSEEVVTGNCYFPNTHTYPAQTGRASSD
jgi:hypothetical protein